MNFLPGIFPSPAEKYYKYLCLLWKNLWICKNITLNKVKEKIDCYANVFHLLKLFPLHTQSCKNYDFCLPSRQFQATVEETASLTRYSHYILLFNVRPEGHREPRNEVESLSTTECSVTFERAAFRLKRYTLTH